ncbi:MAG: hypothetical protein QOJ53_1983 [Sphingomonadales bacterium]|nr:hypothetical protein [Sphingomonadales bacterium]
MIQTAVGAQKRVPAPNAATALSIRPEKVARPEGFEPPAPRFVVWCSIQLSYGRAGGVDIGARPEWRNPRGRRRGRCLRRRRPVLPERKRAHREGG